jgi:hypothetical protein
MSLTTINCQLAFVSPKRRWRSYVQGYPLGGEGSCARMIFIQKYLRNHSDLDTCSYEHFTHKAVTVTSQSINLSSLIILYTVGLYIAK